MIELAKNFLPPFFCHLCFKKERPSQFVSHRNTSYQNYGPKSRHGHKRNIHFLKTSNSGQHSISKSQDVTEEDFDDFEASLLSPPLKLDESSSRPLTLQNCKNGSSRQINGTSMVATKNETSCKSCTSTGGKVEPTKPTHIPRTQQSINHEENFDSFEASLSLQALEKDKSSSKPMNGTARQINGTSMVATKNRETRRFNLNRTIAEGKVVSTNPTDISCTPQSTNQQEPVKSNNVIKQINPQLLRCGNASEMGNILCSKKRDISLNSNSISLKLKVSSLASCLQSSKANHKKIVPFAFDTPEPTSFSKVKESLEKSVSKPPPGIYEPIKFVGVDKDSDKPISSDSQALSLSEILSSKQGSSSVIGSPSFNNKSIFGSTNSVHNKPTNRKQLLKVFRKRYIDPDFKQRLNLLVVGDSGVGKSTLLGMLMHQLGDVSEKELANYSWELEKLGSNSSPYAWVLDQFKIERNRGMSTEVGQAVIETDNKKVTVFDSPGHSDMLPCLLSSASTADAALLVIDANPEKLERDLSKEGRLREKIMAIRFLGVERLLVTVNKMDLVGWSESIYRRCVEILGNFLKAVPIKNTLFCPVSCSDASNLTNLSHENNKQSWYTDPCLLTLIDSLPSPQKQTDSPLRFAVMNRFKPAGSSGHLAVSGRVEQGGLSAGIKSSTGKVLCTSSGLLAGIKSVRVMNPAHLHAASSDVMDETRVSHAFAGDYVTLILSSPEDPSSTITQCTTLCDPGLPIPCTNRIRARLSVIYIDDPIALGSQFVFHYMSINITAVIKKLISVTSKSESKKRPRVIVSSQVTVEAVIELERSIPIDVHEESSSLGRFMLVQTGRIIAGGRVTKVLPAKKALIEPD